MFNFSSLNNKQQEAVKATQGAVLVLAGAGTGKTRVLTSRIAYIVSENMCDIKQILAVTFTNKAANEMKERVRDILDTGDGSFSGGYSLWIGTFHSLALKMIRPYSDYFGRTANFTIIDSEDQKRLIKKIMKELSIDDKKFKPKSIAFYINGWKDKLQSYATIQNMGRKFSAEEVALKVYRRYEDMLRSLDALDFGDILFYCVNLLKSHEEILQTFQDLFKYIMVDEYQDTNIAQYMWLRLLSMKHKNICCVGDDDQSIYGWRGADVGNILKFSKDFADAKVIRLEQNYRSTGNILNTANAIISKNSSRMDKKLWTEKEEGMPVCIKTLFDPTEEAAFVCSVIENKKKDVPYKDVAILVRAAFQMRAFEDRFLHFGIPYAITGGMKFYERKEVKDAIAYIRLIANPDDGVAFERIVNMPKRGIGAMSIVKFYNTASQQNLSLPKAAESLQLPKLQSFFEMIEKFRNLSKTCDLSGLMKIVLEESGYISMLSEKNNIEDEGRLEILQELVAALHDFSDIQEFLDYVSLITDNLANQFTTECVTISTIHSAKGLEYKMIFIPGFEENLFPHQRAIEDSGELGIEEERRLFYVALTRAKNEAYITMCRRRSLYNQAWQNVFPSRFLQNLPKNSTHII